MRRHRRRRPLPAEPFTLDIEKLSHEGRGIGHREGKVVFVDEALPGEQVEARLSGRRDSYDEAVTVNVLRASPERVTPPCEYASICGGCSLQHFEASAQLRFKEAVLHEKIQHVTGRDDYLHLPAVTGPTLGYRRKARLAVRHVAKKEQVLVGFREKRSSFITHMSHCQILHPRVGELLPALSALVAQLQGYRQIPQIEVAVGDSVADANDLALVMRHLQPLSAADRGILADFAREHSLDMYLQSGGPDTVHRHYPQGGVERLHYLLPDYDLDMAFHPMDFTQVNADINRSMLQRALELLQLQDSDRVLDLFCGLGNFTLPMARYSAWVCGVEGSDEMVLRGNGNAQANGVSNVEFHRADLTLPIADKPWMTHSYNKVLLDPPRSGAMEVIDNLLALAPERIVYISCNPATLARDTGLLEAGGYRLQAAGVLDMFPQTTHVESIALFTREE